MIILDAEYSSVGSIAQLLTVTLIFIFVLALTYFTTRFAGTYKKQQMMGKNIQIVETMSLNASKYLQIVKVGSQYFLIAVTKDNVTMLGEIEEDQLVFSEEESSGTDFKTIFEKFRKNGQKLEGQETDHEEKDS